MRITHALVSRMRDNDGKPLGVFKIDGVGGAGNSRYDFVDAQFVPEFEGEQGWFELERVFAGTSSALDLERLLAEYDQVVGLGCEPSVAVPG